MQKLAIVLIVATFAAFSLAAIRPESKLYFSIPLGPAPAAATTAAPAAATPAANATADNSTTAAAGATTSASTGLALTVMPLGQLLGMILTGLFGSTLPGGTAATGATLSVVPLGQALGMLLSGLFGGLSG